MNQILMTKDKKGKVAIGLKPIIRFFAIIAIVIAAILIIQAVVRVSKNISERQNAPIAQLTYEMNGSILKLHLTDENVISRIEYNWNDGVLATTPVGKKNADVEILVPNGKNDIHIVAIDVDGNRTKFDTFSVEFSKEEDKTKPEISVQQSKNTGMINITAKDSVEMASIEYKWDDGDSVTINVDPNKDSKTITVEVPVQKGIHSIKVVAKDKAGNQATTEMQVAGSNGSKITARLKDSSTFIIKVTSEIKITKVTYTLNDVEHRISNIPENSKEIEFEVPLEDGLNLLKINAYENNVMTEYKCKKTK